VAQSNHYFWNAERTVSFDGSDKVAPGGVVAWEIEIETPSGVLESSHSFQTGLYLVRGVFEVTPVPGGSLKWRATSERLGAPTAGSEPGALRWEATQLAPQTLGRPVDFIANPLEIRVRCVPPSQSASAPATWEERARFVDGIMAPKTDSGGEVKAKAEALAAGNGSRWGRIRALAEFVQRDIVYLAISLDKDYLWGFRPHATPETLHSRYGDCKDKATLLVSMLRAIGDRGYVVLVNAGNPTETLADWPSVDFNHAIVAVPADGDVPPGWPVVDAGPLGRLVIFDPTDSVTPLGVLSPGDQGGYGLILAANGGRLVKLPMADPAFSRVIQSIEAQLNAAGDLQVSVKEIHEGLLAAEIYSARFNLGAARFKQRIEARVQEATPLGEDLQWSDHWDPVAARYQLDASFTAEKYARSMGDDLMIVTPQLLPGTARLLPWKTAAEGVVWLPPILVEEEVHLRLPAGYAVEEMPDAWNQDQSSASGHLRYRAENGTVVYQSRFSQRGGFYDRGDYETLRLFYQKFRDAQRRPLLLRNAAP
jgi:hypothetical protein